jgi:hypothetical protein
MDRYPLKSRLFHIPRAAMFAALVGLAAGCTKPSAGASSTSDPSSDPGDKSTTKDASGAVTGAADGSVASASLNVGTDPLFKDDSAVVEGFDDGSAAFAIAPDGSTKVALADADGKPITDRKMKMTYSIDESDKTVEVPLRYDDDHHYLVANGPELALNVTPVRYDISGGAKSWTGVLHLPAGGTKALNVSAQLAASVHAKPIVGPHGGRVERVGDDDVEVLLDSESGEARAWIVADGKVVTPKERSFSLVLDAREVELFPDLNDSFYAKVSFDASFSFTAVHKVSCVLTHGSVMSTLVFGFRPHVYLVAARPSLDVVVVGWTKEKKVKWDKNPNEPGLGWAAGKEKHGGGGSAGVSVDVHVGGGGGGGDKHGGGKGGGGGGKGHGKH